jgi:hypothetical protein
MHALGGSVVGWRVIDPEPGVAYERRWAVH